MGRLNTPARDRRLPFMPNLDCSAYRAELVPRARRPALIHIVISITYEFEVLF